MNIHVEESGLRPRAIARVESGFDFLSAEYAELYRRSCASAFQRPLWLQSIYDVLAPGLGARAHVITLRSAPTGDLQMVVPLVRQRSCGVTVLQPADLGVCDYNSIVASPETMRSVAADAGLLRQIRTLLKVGDVLIFRKLKEHRAETAAILGLDALTSNENSAFDVELGGTDFGEWQRAHLKKRFRNGASRRLRKIRADHRCVDFVTFSDPGEIEAAIRFIAKHRSARFKDDILRQEAYFDFYLHHALAGAPRGDAVTSGLVVDGTLVSADFGIVGNGAYHSILCAARLDTYGQYAPGMLGLMELLRSRHATGEARFDFGIGSSRQKSDFAATEHPLYNLTAATSIKGSLVSLIYNRAKPMKTMLRRRFASIR
ncbi:MAG: GNAT family N-acetyltransferase [Alphaproteobacteria bacterium]|nr:GNAT family N-acetyltransferase [Alphaproteobacteria bacterium]